MQWKNIFTILTVLVLLNCSSNSQDKQLSTAIDKSQESQQLASKTVTITPVDATRQTIIKLNTNIPLVSKEKIYWYVNDIKDTSAKGMRFSSDEIHKGDLIRAVIADEKNEYSSNEITIQNTPPMITHAHIDPERPKVDTTLTVQLKAYDADNDIVSFKYKWTLNGKFTGENYYLDTDLKRGDTIDLEVTPYDDENSGNTIKLSSTVYNSLPSTEETSPTFDGTNYTYQVRAHDPDNDPLEFKLEQGPSGMQIDPVSGLITWKVNPENYGYHEVKVLIDDNHGGQLFVPFTTKIHVSDKSSSS